MVSPHFHGFEARGNRVVVGGCVTSRRGRSRTARRWRSTHGGCHRSCVSCDCVLANGHSAVGAVRERPGDGGQHTADGSYCRPAATGWRARHASPLGRQAMWEIPPRFQAEAGPFANGPYTGERGCVQQLDRVLAGRGGRGTPSACRYWCAVWQLRGLGLTSGPAQEPRLGAVRERPGDGGRHTADGIHAA